MWRQCSVGWSKVKRSIFRVSCFEGLTCFVGPWTQRWSSWPGWGVNWGWRLLSFVNEFLSTGRWSSNSRCFVARPCGRLCALLFHSVTSSYLPLILLSSILPSVCSHPLGFHLFSLFSFVPLSLFSSYLLSFLPFFHLILSFSFFRLPPCFLLFSPSPRLFSLTFTSILPLYLCLSLIFVCFLYSLHSLFFSNIFFPPHFFILFSFFLVFSFQSSVLMLFSDCYFFYFFLFFILSLLPSLSLHLFFLHISSSSFSSLYISLCSFTPPLCPHMFSPPPPSPLTILPPSVHLFHRWLFFCWSLALQEDDD